MTAQLALVTYCALTRQELFAYFTSSPSTLYVETQLQVRTTALDQNVMSAGSTAVGQRMVKQSTVSNSSNEVLPLATDLLSPQGTFSLVNAVRPLAGNGSITVSIAFLPQVSLCLYSHFMPCILTAILPGGSSYSVSLSSGCIVTLVSSLWLHTRLC